MKDRLQRACLVGVEYVESVIAEPMTGADRTYFA
jgi:hypothetical protein